jgi:glycosyltransferase involved in cell wall biosynthesis
VLFFRTFRSFHGGHLKVWDYYNHVLSDTSFVPYIRFARSSSWDQSNPWSTIAMERVRTVEPDVLFLAGRDWMNLSEQERADPPVPVINLIQHVRHADPDHPLSVFLPYPAVRICVAPEVAERIEATGKARGPVLAIPNGIDTAGLVRAHRGATDRDDLLIVANKKPELGRRLADRLRSEGRALTLIDELVPRDDFLTRLASARVTLFLPNVEEGFYLPALEAMALRSIVVCPDVIGNRSFCIDGRTAYRPPYADDELVAATEDALRADDATRDAMLRAGSEMAAEHDLSRERARFLEILHDVDTLWRG